jgi:hypothetical protein
VANILSNPLKLLAPMLASLVSPGGSLVLSGVLERQVDEVADFYRESLPVRLWRNREGWVCLAGQRPAREVAAPEVAAPGAGGPDAGSAPGSGRPLRSRAVAGPGSGGAEAGQ